MCLTAAVVVLLVSADLAWAQAKPKPKRLPAAQELGGNNLVTRDGVQLAATFHPGTAGKETVPVILLHMWKGDRKAYADLAVYLQEQGHAVLVPDLRGHGDSTGVLGSVRKLDASKMPSGHFYQMPYGDLETLRRFLVEKNDAGELNLSKLCLVGAEMGASVAAYYAFYDWTTLRRESGRAAASQDVKAMVLISPDWGFRHLPLSKPLNHPLVRSQIAVYVLVGEDDSTAVSDARRVRSLLYRYHADLGDGSTKEGLSFRPFPTKLQGTKLLNVKELKPDPASLIGKFIELYATKRSYPWRQRGSKSGAGGNP
jgi:pimeloyl-ACP methyl ester carboxylesterase